MGYFEQKTPVLVILNKVKDLSKTRRRENTDTVTINDRFTSSVATLVSHMRSE